MTRKSTSCDVEDRVLWEWVENSGASSNYELAAHIEACADCRSRVEAMRRLEVGLRMLADAPPAQAPDRIGPYEVVRQVGEGGMGIVYEALQSSPDRRVAIKVLHACRVSSAPMHRALAREARVLARLHHPAIAAIHDAGTTEDGRPYIVVDFIDGQPIDRHAAEEDLSLGERVELLIDVARAVHHAHQRGVLHCDLKPANVLVDRDGTPRVVDFGLARPIVEELGWTMSVHASGMMGTVPYMSPEQARGDVDEIDVRTDVFGLGATAHALLLGRAPGANIGHADRPRAPKDDLGARNAPAMRLPRELRDILDKALHEDPRQRYDSAAGLANDLQAFLEGGAVQARTSSFLYRLRVLLRQHTAAVSVTLGLMVALVGAVVFTQRAYQRASDQRAEVIGFLAGVLEEMRQSANSRESRERNLDLQMLNRVAGMLSAETVFDSDTAETATLHAGLGRIYRLLSWDEGEEQFERLALRHTGAALETRQKLFGADHPDTISSMYEYGLLVRGDDRQKWVERYERIGDRHVEGRVPECLGLARILLELSHSSPMAEREAYARDAMGMFERLDAPPGERVAARRRLVQIAHERGEPARAAELHREYEIVRDQFSLASELDFGRVTILEGNRIGFCGPRPGVLFDDECWADSGPGCYAHVGTDTMVVRTTWTGEMNCGSDFYLSLDLRPRPDDPAPHPTGIDIDVRELVGTLFHPPIDADPFVDNVDVSFRLWKVFHHGTDRLEFAIDIRRSGNTCGWPPTGYRLCFLEPLFVAHTSGPNVCLVTTHHPTDPSKDADTVEIRKNGEVLGTYRMPMTWKVERIRAESR